MHYRIRLSVMMLLEYFIWGAWYVTMSTYLQYGLGASGMQIGTAYAALSIGAIASPFLIGFIADRYLAAQKLMAILHLAGAVMLYGAAESLHFASFYPFLLLYTLSYMPTIALSNRICFHQMEAPEKEFALIRVFGTLGWILAGLVLDHMGWERSAMSFKLAATAACMLGVFSFFLPDTPPQHKGSAGSPGVTAAFFSPEMGILFKSRSFMVFFIASVLICIPLAFYYNFTNLFFNVSGMKNAASVMSLGQFSELFFLLAIGFLFRHLGIKWMLGIAMLAWVLRFLLFASGNMQGNEWMLYMGIIIHGVCYDFFFVTGQIYTDKRAGEKIKGAAQGLITLATYGVGMLIGSFVSGKTAALFSHAGIYEWKNFWLVPAFIAAGSLLFFMLLFKDKSAVKNTLVTTSEL